MKVGFLVNPYAGSGGRIGRKGSDDLRVENPEIPFRVKRFLNLAPKVKYFVPRGKMGEVYFRGTDFDYEVIDAGRDNSTREDTIASVKILQDVVDVITFVGGDGTARDVAGALTRDLPILGIPAGVKMHSGVFATTPEAAARILSDFVQGNARVVKAEVLDVDEEEYRRGNFVVKLFFVVSTISSGNLLTPSKEEYSSSNADDISEFVIDMMEDNVYYVMGPGKTVKSIEERLGYSTNFLSTDLFLGKRLIKAGISYFDLISLTGELKVILSPIGGQGFLIGRGNQEIGPEVLKRVGKKGIIVVSSREKLRSIDCLRIDTGDPEVDKLLQGVYNVIVGYNEFMPVKTCSNT
ncbi:MAG: ATP-NAD/AcoX kinase [Candidatus Aramenus sulfurataquae]|jgi:predicted polyphosphate/ATP-dependent NAD kinase|uniref:ATP-NAD kinase n=2 Tax=Candidatus Aramenus sulfurataquae TaxID=1326980 RepID=W7KWK3_9CREN|nr:MAG: ATP-NAD/AcoX kinase [Candidatus Aramenus sulfurataquae]MCL7344052.1 ATP-NAD kinase family protein [Candidatus Aramenus sulfurataquae]